MNPLTDTQMSAIWLRISGHVLNRVDLLDEDLWWRKSRRKVRAWLRRHNRPETFADVMEAVEREYDHYVKECLG